MFEPFENSLLNIHSVHLLNLLLELAQLLMKIAIHLACENWFGDEESELDRFRLFPKLLKISLVVPGTLRRVGVLVRSVRGLHDRRAGQREVINVVCGPDAAEEILSCNSCET